MIEFGQQNPDVVMLLHGGGLSWWNYREVATLLAERYHVVLPVLDGHTDSDAHFTTIEDNGARLISYIDTHFGGQILAIGGLSLGGQVTVELTHALIGPTFGMSYGLIKQKWFAKLQADYLGIPKALFNDYYRDTCKISKADMVAFMKANSIYTIKRSLSETKAKVKIVAGSREQKSIRDSAVLLNREIPGSSLEILPGMRHGDLSINHPQDYARMLIEWIDSKI